MSQQLRFAIGDKVFTSRFGRTEKWITCPDCGGTKRVKVTLHDGTEILIECGGCYPGGHEQPQGRIRQYDMTVEVDELTITGFSVNPSGVEYQASGCRHTDHFSTGWHLKDSETFATQEEARAFGETLRATHEEAENKRLLAKTKDHRSWAWNATYHRQCIKRAERDLAYHKSKAEICAAKAKVPDGDD